MYETVFPKILRSGKQYLVNELLCVQLLDNYMYCTFDLLCEGQSADSHGFLFVCLFVCVCLCFCGFFFCLLSIICRHTLYCYIVDVLNSIFDDLCIICKIYIYIFFTHV